MANREKVIIVFTALVAGLMPVGCDWKESQDSVAELRDAIVFGRFEKIESILGKEPELVSAKDNAGQTPLHTAAAASNKRIAELLIAKGADVNARDNGGNTALHRAVGVEICELLINNGAQVNGKNNIGRTPLLDLVVSSWY